MDEAEKHSKRRSIQPRDVVLLVVVAIAVLAVVANVLIQQDWFLHIDNATQAAQVQAWAAIVQTVVAACLLIVTAVYAAFTWGIVRSNEKMVETNQEIAKASDRSAKAASDAVRASRETLALQQKQQRDATLPVLVFALTGVLGKVQRRGSPEVTHFAVQITNAGSGPAVDVEFRITDCGLNYDRKGELAIPFALAAGESTEYMFTDANPMWKAPTREKRELYLNDVRGFEIVGTLEAVYRDIYKREIITTADLLTIPSENPKDGPQVKLGPIHVQLPD